MSTGLQWKNRFVREKRPKEEAPDAGSQILHTLRQLEQEIQRNEAMFDLTSESDLMDACIYEGQALRSRYRYYHTLARSMGIRCRESRMAQRVR